MDIIIRTVFNNQNWMGKCKNADKDPRLYKCQEKVVNVKFPNSGEFKTDRLGNCACLWCYESTLCTEYRWVDEKSFAEADGKAYFVFPDVDGTLVLWGFSEVDHVEKVRDMHYLYLKEFKPLPEENWVRGLRVKEILGTSWNRGTYRYLTQEKSENLEKMIKNRSRYIAEQKTMAL